MSIADLGLIIALLALVAGVIQALGTVVQQKSEKRKAMSTLIDPGTSAFNDLRATVLAKLRREVNLRISRATELVDINLKIENTHGSELISSSSISEKIPLKGLVFITGGPGSGKTVLAQQLCIAVNTGKTLIADTFPAGGYRSSYSSLDQLISTQAAIRWSIHPSLVNKLIAERAIVPILDQADSLSLLDLSALIELCLNYVTTGGMVAIAISDSRLYESVERMKREFATRVTVLPLTRDQIISRVAHEINPGPGMELIRTPSLNEPIYKFVTRPLWLGAFLHVRRLPRLDLLQSPELADILVDDSLHRFRHNTRKYSESQVSLWLSTFFRTEIGPLSVTDALIEGVEELPEFAVSTFRLVLAFLVGALAKHYYGWWTVGIIVFTTFLFVGRQNRIVLRWRDIRRSGQPTSQARPWAHSLRLEWAAFLCVFGSILALGVLRKQPIIAAVSIALILATESSLYLSVVLLAIRCKLAWQGLLPLRISKFMNACANETGALLVNNGRKYEFRHAEIAESILRRSRQIFPR